MTSLEYYMMYGEMPEPERQPLLGGKENFGGQALGGTQSALGFSTPSESFQAARLKDKGRQVMSAITRGITDPYYAFTPGEDSRRQEARDRILAKVAQAMTDPMAATFVPAKGMEAGAFTDLLSKKTMREIADDGARFNGFVSPKITEVLNGKYHQYLSHPELIEAQPQLSDINITGLTGPGKSGGYYNQGDVINIKYSTSEGGKGTLLHETQHAVQENANWPRGGSPEGTLLNRFDDPLLNTLADMKVKLDALNAERVAVQKQMQDLPFGSSERKAMHQRLEELNSLASPMTSDFIKLTEKTQPFGQYQRLWGEEQARRTANRMDMTAEERMGRPYGEKLIERPDGTYTYGGKGATDVPNVEDLILRYRDGGSSMSVEAGNPFKFIHNTEKSPYMGERFGQHLEPTGRYMQEAPSTFDQTMFPNMIYGDITFKNPLKIDFGGGYTEATNWKHVLSEKYGGKTGNALTRAIMKDGYDGIVTIGKNGETSEIVDLTNWTPRKKRR